MRLGFNWELGPFELWDAAGIEATVARMKKEGKPVAANVEKLLAAGKKSWYEDAPKPHPAATISISKLETRNPKLFLQACGPSKSQKNPTAWSRKIPEHRLSTSAMAWAASSSIPR